jgi:spore germination protein YaaH
MKTITKITFLVFFITLLSPIFAQAKTSSENIFYYYPSERAYQSLEENYRDIDIFAPQIYTVGYDLKLGDAESEDALKFAKKKRMDVMPLVVQSDFSKQLMTYILDNKDAQDELIDDLIDEAKDRNFIGWQFDFENLNHLDRDKYVDFVKKTSKEFNKKKLLFSVAVIPRTTDYNPDSTNQDWSSGYNIKEIAKYTDFISIMSYDDPLSKGPVSSMEYLEKALAHTQKFVDDDKISLGIPLYCWQYEIGNPKKIANVTYPISAATQEKYKEYGALSTYVDDYESEVFLFIKPKENTYALNIIWCDNEQSIKAKKELAKDENLHGLSFWALGQEDERMWKHL